MKRAQNKGLAEIYIHNLRDYTEDKYRRVDDYPFGGFAGMVMNMYFCKPFILSTFHYRAIEEAFNHFRQNSNDINTHIFYFFRKNSVS
jgi:tRNA (guanine-N1)-methyltransferase